MKELKITGIEMHVGEAQTLQVLAAIRNSNFYEMGTLHPNRPPKENPLYHPDFPYRGKRLDAVGKDGCVPVPGGPGLGVVYNWKFIEGHRTAFKKYP